MNFLIIKYKREMNVNAVVKTVAMLQYCWDLVISNRLFSASFTVSKEEKDSDCRRRKRKTRLKISFIP